MAELVLTAIGADRAGLVAALADTVRFHGGNWERSDLAEIAGTFAGLVQVSLPNNRVDAFITDLESLDADLDVQVRLGQPEATAPPRRLRIELVGDDRAGIVDEVSAELARVGAGISRLETETRDAPMAGGRLFSLVAEVTIEDQTDLDSVRDGLESLSHELMVEIIDRSGP